MTVHAIPDRHGAGTAVAPDASTQPIEALLEEAREAIARGAFTEALDRASSACEQARQQGLKRLSVESNACRCLCALRMTEFEQVIEWGLEGLADLDVLDDPKLGSECRNLLVMAYAAIGMHGEALQHGAASLRDAQRCGLPDTVSWALNRMAIVYEGLGLFDLAVEHMEMAVDAGARSGIRETEFAAKSNLSELLIERVDSGEVDGDDAVRALASESLRLSTDCRALANDHPHRLMRCAWVEALALLALGSLDEVRQRIDEHVALAERMALHAERVRTQFLLARWHLAAGRAQEAHQILTAMQTGFPFRDADRAIRALLALRSVACRQVGDLQGQVLALEETIALDRKLMRQRSEAQTRVRMREIETMGLLAARDEARALKEEAEALRREAASAKDLALSDTLTGLPNRRALDQRLSEGVARARRGEGRLHAALIDVDHFKSVNDQLGHDAGDRLLAQLGALLKAHFGSHGFAARNGGEEFVVLFQDLDRNTVEATCSSFVDAVRRENWDAIEPGRRVTVSLGVAGWTPGEEGPALLRRADSAMYEAKRLGRDCWIAR